MLLIKSLIVLAVLIIVLLLGIEFSAVNSHNVEFGYVVGTAQWPLSFVIFGAFAVGVVVTILVSLAVILPLRWRVNRLSRTLAAQDQELSTLLRKSGQSARRA